MLKEQYNKDPKTWKDLYIKAMVNLKDSMVSCGDIDQAREIINIITHIDSKM